MEGSLAVSSDAAYIEKSYYSIDPDKIVNKSEATGITAYQSNNSPLYNNNPNSSSEAFSEKVYKLTGTTTSGVTGLGITLKVMAGDKINIFGKSYYFENNSQPKHSVPVSNILGDSLVQPAAWLLVRGFLVQHSTD